MRPRSSATIFKPVAANSLHIIVPATPAPTTTISTDLSLVLAIVFHTVPTRMTCEAPEPLSPLEEIPGHWTEKFVRSYFVGQAINYPCRRTPPVHGAPAYENGSHQPI